MENKIYNSLSTQFFVSPCVYKLIIYIYIYLVVWSQPFRKKVLFEAGFEPAHCKHAIQSRNRSCHPILN